MTGNALPMYYGTVLHEGDRGPDVGLVQQWLNGAEDRYPELERVTVDGKFGADTAAAVKAYQKLMGLTADGEVGADTWDSLYATYDALHGTGEIWPGVTMREGDRGAAVHSAQARLKLLVPSLTVDGRYGVHTRNAVFAFQVIHDLTPDGVLGQKTWEMLYA